MLYFEKMMDIFNLSVVVHGNFTQYMPFLPFVHIARSSPQKSLLQLRNQLFMSFRNMREGLLLVKSMVNLTKNLKLKKNTPTAKGIAQE